jgi:hypothetical protein
MAAKKNTEGMAFIVESLKNSKSASYADIKAAADKKGLKVWPIMFGRAQLLLGHVKGAKRGTGKYAKANAAKAAGGLPRGRKPDASSKSGQVRELLQRGMAPMDIAKKVGCTPGLVYNVKSTLSGGSKNAGRVNKNARPAANGFAGLDSILQTVRNTQADMGRYRAALERMQSLLSEVLG